MTRRFQTVSGPLIGLLALLLVLPSAGCDPVDPEMFPEGDTLTLFSLARPEYVGQVSAVDVYGALRTVNVEQAKPVSDPDFDFAFSELDGDFVLLPAGLFEGYTVTPGIIEVSGAFETVDRAPDEDYITDAAVPLVENGLYVVRSRSVGSCRRYAKVEVLDLDPDGILEFRFLWSNLCNDRSLPTVDED
jgi:hypothetical protein